jgi:hypothetical protein
MQDSMQLVSLEGVQLPATLEVFSVVSPHKHTHARAIGDPLLMRCFPNATGRKQKLEQPCGRRVPAKFEHFILGAFHLRKPTRILHGTYFN